MNTANPKRKLWPFPVAVGFSIATLAATFYSYAEQHRPGSAGRPIPLTLAIVVFALVMFFLTDAMIAEAGRRRLWVSIAIAAGETFVFAYALMFLLLNIYGS